MSSQCCRQSSFCFTLWDLEEQQGVMDGGMCEVMAAGSFRKPNLWGTRIGLYFLVFMMLSGQICNKSGYFASSIDRFTFLLNYKYTPFNYLIVLFWIIWQRVKKVSTLFSKISFQHNTGLGLDFVSSEYCYTVTNVTVQVCYNKWGPALSLEKPEHVSTLCLQRVFVDYFLYK